MRAARYDYAKSDMTERAGKQTKGVSGPPHRRRRSRGSQSPHIGFDSLRPGASHYRECRSNWRIGSVTRSTSPRVPERSTCRAIAYGAVSSAVIPAERSESRDPCTPVLPLFLMPGYLGPGSAAHHFVLRCARDDSRDSCDAYAIACRVRGEVEQAERQARLSCRDDSIRAALWCPLLPKFVPEGAAIHHELRKRALSRVT